MTTESDLIRLRKQVERLPDDLRARYVLGRLRTDRTAPSSHSDVTASDFEGDIVRSATWEYLLVNDGGTLKWARHAIDVTW